MSELREQYDKDHLEWFITQPDLAELETRTRQYRRRRHLTIGTTALLVAALLAVPVFVLRGSESSSPPATVKRDQVKPNPDPEWPEDMRVDFVDTDHGVAYYPHGTEEKCRGLRLRMTSNGGRTWGPERRVPNLGSSDAPVGAVNCLISEVILLDRDVLIAHSQNHPHKPEKSAHISYDGGRTWDRFVPEVRRVDKMPKDASPSLFCSKAAGFVSSRDRHGPCPKSKAGLGYYDPVTRDRLTLRAIPDELDRLNEPVRAPDGSLWVMGESNGVPAVAVSHDSGGSWRVSQLNDAEGAFSNQLDNHSVEVYDGNHAYALLVSEEGQSALHRTDDGGKTWHQATGQQLPEYVERMWIRSDGAVLLGVKGTWYASRDGGETFTKVKLPQIAGVDRLRDGYLGSVFVFPPEDDPEAEGHRYHHLSTDGVTWRALKPPPH